jgi:CYTH domain-containing protein
MSAPKNVEIERKFLIKSDAWRQQKIESSEDLRQGFLSVDPERTVRVRVRAGKGYLTIKGKTKVSMANATWRVWTATWLHATERMRFKKNDLISLLKGASRAEYEYEIPTDEATEMLDTLCPRYARSDAY